MAVRTKGKMSSPYVAVWVIGGKMNPHEAVRTKKVEWRLALGGGDIGWNDEVHEEHGVHEGKRDTRYVEEEDILVSLQDGVE